MAGLYSIKQDVGVFEIGPYKSHSFCFFFDHLSDIIFFHPKVGWEIVLANILYIPLKVYIHRNSRIQAPFSHYQYQGSDGQEIDLFCTF